jgi:hypothetical protein
VLPGEALVGRREGLDFESSPARRGRLLRSLKLMRGRLEPHCHGDHVEAKYENLNVP